jgi:acyl-CoA hydrolase
MVVSDGLGVPRSAPAPLLEHHAPVVGWMPAMPEWASRLNEALALMAGASARELVRSARVAYLPIRYSALARALSETLRPAVAVIAGRPDPGGFRFGLEVGYAGLAARLAERVVVEVDPSLPMVRDAPLVNRTDVEVVEAAVPAPALRERAPDPVDAAIGERIAGLVPAGAMVQYGPGGIGDSAIRALPVPVRVHSGMISDAVVDLAQRGLLVGVATAAYLLGSRQLRDLAEAGLVALRGVEDTHDPARLAGFERFVAINSALTVGLDGAVNAERVRGELIGGVGGHPDFCAAAATSTGGLSIIGLRSAGGGRSNIVKSAHPVTTARSDVDLVVTEHGVADLRGLDDRRRAAALITIADPAFRESLEREALLGG